MPRGKGKGKNTTVYMRLDEVPVWEAFCNVTGDRRNRVIMSLVAEYVNRLTGKEQQDQVYIARVGELEAMLFALLQEIKQREKTLRNKRYDVHRTIYDLLYDLVFQRFGFQPDNFDYDEVLGKLYSYRVAENDGFTQMDLELFTQLVERNQKRNKVYAALQDARSKIKGNPLLLETLIEPMANQADNNDGEDQEGEEPEKPASEVSVQPEPEPEPTQPEEEEETEDTEEQQEEPENDNADQEEESRGFRY